MIINRYFFIMKLSFSLYVLFFACSFLSFDSSAELNRGNLVETVTKENKTNNKWMAKLKDKTLVKFLKIQDEWIKIKDKRDKAFDKWIKAEDKYKEKAYNEWAKLDDRWEKIDVKMEKASNESNKSYWAMRESRRIFFLAKLSPEDKKADDEQRKLFTVLQRAMDKKNKAAAERDKVFAELKRTIPEFRRAVAERDKARHEMGEALIVNVIEKK